VKVLDQRLHNLPESWGVARLPLFVSEIGKVFLGSVWHWNFPLWL